MSIETWRQEFYPVPASCVAPKDATAHALHKWRGLTPNNLKDHELILDSVSDLEDAEGGTFSISSATCALCEVVGKDAVLGCDSNPKDCTRCPIYHAVGRTCAAEFRVHMKTGDPQPMITLLNTTLKWEKSQSQANKAVIDVLTDELSDKVLADINGGKAI